MLAPSSPLAVAGLRENLPECNLHSGKRKSRLPTVLVADDDVDNLMLVSYILEQFDCVLFSAIDGQTALNLVWKLQPDLILLDIRLPNLSGLELMQRLKQHQTTCKIPIIAVTALAGIEDRQKIMHAGCDQYISKPYMLDDMKTLISHYLLLTKEGVGTERSPY